MKHNFMACVDVIAEKIAGYELEHVRAVTTIFDIDQILDKKITITDNQMYVYPSGSRMSQTRSNEGAMEIGVGISFVAKINTAKKIQYYNRIGETMTELRKQLLNESVLKSSEYKTRFMEPKHIGDDSHTFGDGFFIFSTRIIYTALINN